MPNSRFDSSAPIYQQICSYIKSKILSGEIRPGEKVASVRELAMALNVNPNTMQKALSILDQEGLLYSERTTGRYVTNNQDRLDDLRKDRIAEIINSFFTDMHNIGISPSDAQAIINQSDKQLYTRE